MTKEKKKSQELNAQFNILIENELNAIGKLPPDLSNRAMVILEKVAEHRIQSDNKIIELEKENLKLQKSETNKYYFWSGLGIVCFFLISFTSLLGGVFLAYNAKTTEAFIAFLISLINIAPRVLKEFKKY